MDRVGNLKLGTGCWNTKLSFFHRPLAVFLSTYGHRFFLGWVIHRIWAILLLLLPLDGSHIVCNPLHLPTFWKINLQNYSRKDEGIRCAGSNPPFPFFLFPLSSCLSLPAAGFLTENTHNCPRSYNIALSQQAVHWRQCLPRMITQKLPILNSKFKTSNLVYFTDLW